MNIHNVLDAKQIKNIYDYKTSTSGYSSDRTYKIVMYFHDKSAGWFGSKETSKVLTFKNEQMYKRCESQVKDILRDTITINKSLFDELVEKAKKTSHPEDDSMFLKNIDTAKKNNERNNRRY